MKQEKIVEKKVEELAKGFQDYIEMQFLRNPNAMHIYVNDLVEVCGVLSKDNNLSDAETAAAEIIALISRLKIISEKMNIPKALLYAVSQNLMERDIRGEDIVKIIPINHQTTTTIN